VLLSHFEAFAPICVRCRLLGRGEQRLALGVVARRDGDDLLDATLQCEVPECRFEYPVIAGIPILVSDVRDHVVRALPELRAGDALSPLAESILGDCAGPDSELGRSRLYLSSYGQAHWGDLGPGATPATAGLVPVLDAALELAARGDGGVSGRWLDLGCSVGRGAFELAARTGALALGLDVSVAMLRCARRIARTGRLRHPVRQVGVVHGTRDVPLDLPHRDRVDFWYADATALPLRAGSVAGALALNTLDSVAVPLALLHELAHVLADGGRGVLATPYDWAAHATPIEHWIGGHSQRGPGGGSSAAELRRILAATDRPAGAPSLAIDAARDDVTWVMTMHERAAVHYRLDMVRVRPDR
jgi:SAM-dependent methyltransferase